MQPAKNLLRLWAWGRFMAIELERFTAKSTFALRYRCPREPFDTSGRTVGNSGAERREDDALLQLIWLASPALPIGGFSYSEGLEALVEYAQAAIKKEAAKDTDITQWLVDQLHLSLARSDLAVLAQAVPAFRVGDDERIAALNQWVLATRETSELRAQTVQMGHSMTQWLENLQPDLRPEVQTGLPATPPALAFPLAYPLVFARAAANTTASVRSICLTFAFGWAENMVAAAVKSVPLGQSAGQRMLARLAAEIPQAVDQALQTPDEDRQAFSPMLAILSAQHETQYSRLFRS